MTAAVGLRKPFLRADQVGSLLRPASVHDARTKFHAGEIDAAALRRVEDEAIAEIIKQQEAVGLRAITDGEFRRENWFIDFLGRLGGVSVEAPDEHAAFSSDRPTSYKPKRLMTKARIGDPAIDLVADWRFIADHTRQTAKITIPSPTRLHFHGGRNVVSSEVYPDIEAFFADVAALYQRQIAALEAAGCRYIQIDDPVLSYFIPEKTRNEVVADGDDPDARLDRYVRWINACIAQRSPETTIGLHVCRGNARSAWLAEGGYERIAERVFGGLEVDHLMLEFDDERSGGFEPLRFVPPGRRVVLGLVTTKRGELEDPHLLERRIDEATRYVPIDALALSPQCGFASIVEGNIISEADEWAKLRLVVETAQRVWPDA